MLSRLYNCLLALASNFISFYLHKLCYISLKLHPPLLHLFLPHYFCYISSITLDSAILVMFY